MLIEIFSKYTPREYGFASVLMKKKKSSISRRLPVNRLGFEPKTYSLEGCCSIQLSYRSIPLLIAAAKVVILFYFCKRSHSQEAKVNEPMAFPSFWVMPVSLPQR